MVFADDYCQVLNTLENNLYNECRMPYTNSSYKYKGMTDVINFYSEGVYYKASVVLLMIGQLSFVDFGGVVQWVFLHCR